MDRIDPGEGTQSFVELRAVFLFEIEDGVKVGLSHVFHLDNFDFRKEALL